MKKRFINWFKHIFIKYIPSAKQIAENEAARLSDYITSNYSLKEQLVILDELKIKMILHRNMEVSLKQNEIEKNVKELDQLNKNLEKLHIK